ncbi:MAG: response regulator, partial [Deltaproteobacteria bacterium]|nr:response regulator [Deltaproteobacteria bacterium]
LLFVLVSANTRSLSLVTQQTLESTFRKRLTETAKRGQHLATFEELEKFSKVSDMTLPEYKILRQKLWNFARDADVMYAYYIRVLDGAGLQYVADNDYNEITRVGLDTPVVEVRERPAIRGAVEGRTVLTEVRQYVGGWEGLITCYTPVFDPSGRTAYVFGVDADDAVLTKILQQINSQWKLGMGLFFLTGITGILALIIFWNRARTARTANLAKSLFLSQMSHEIRTPMNAVIGMSELASRDYGRERALEYIENIKRAGHHLMALVNDILDVSKIESGHLEIQSSPYETASLFNDVLTLVAVRLKESQVKLLTEISPSIPAVLIGDAARVKQILLNLLVNAVKYTREGYIKLIVREEKLPNGFLRLKAVVEDTGIGIKREDLGLLFKDFSRLEPDRNAGIEGSGLGLAIVRALCRAMDGQIMVQSQYGRGSIFSVTFIQQASDLKPMGDLKDIALSRIETQSVSFAAPEAEVLVVDDLPTNILVVKGLLIPYQFRVISCTNGRQAIELVREKVFDVILMDHMMPGMDGLEATSIIRAMDDPARSQVPIVALTANALSGMREFFLEAGFNDFLSKPIDLAKLDAILKRWIPAGKRQIFSPVPAAKPSPAPERPEPAWPSIAGLDVGLGLSRAGGSMETYRKVLEDFRLDTEAAMVKMEKVTTEESRTGFIAKIHSLKSGLASIGAVELATMAALMEKSGRDGDLFQINFRLPKFRSGLTALTSRILDFVTSPQPDLAAVLYVRPDVEAFLRLQDALSVKDLEAVNRELKFLMDLQLDETTKEAVAEIVDFILASEFKKASGVISSLIGWKQ